MKLQKQNKLVKIFGRVDLPNQLAAVAGIAAIGIAIISSALSSQQQSNFSSEEASYPYTGGTTQGSSEVTVTPSQPTTIPSTKASSTISSKSNIPSEATVLPNTASSIPSEVTALPNTAPTSTDNTTPASNAFIPPNTTTEPSLPTSSTRSIALSQVPSVVNRDVTATIRETPSVQPVIPPGTTTTLNNATVPDRSPPITSSITNLTNRPSTPPISTTSSISLLRPSSTTAVSSVMVPGRLSSTPSSLTSPTSSTISPLNWSSAKVRPPRRILVAANSSSTRRADYLQQAIDDANATAFGLLVAMHKGEIKLHTSTWKKAQDAIILLRQGKTRQETARRAGIPMSVLVQLLEWGKNRPGASSRLVEKP